MFHHQILNAIAISLVGFISLSGCKSGCKAKSIPAAPVVQKKTHASFPAITTDGLSSEQLASFSKLANEEICPCSCPKTFAGCLQADTKCKPAQILGQWIVDRMKEGMPAEMLSEALSKEIGEGFNGAPQLIDHAGYYSKGAENPKFTVVEFADFNCVHCKDTSPILASFVKKNADKVRLVYKYLPLMPFESGELAGRAVEAAGKQGKFWEMHDAVFQTRTLINEESILANAKAVGLKLEPFKNDLNDAQIKQKVKQSASEASKLGIKGTPQIFINGRPYFLSLDMKGFDMRLAMEMAREEASCN